jgi:transcriptional regulator with XRE-family HTH domain
MTGVVTAQAVQTFAATVGTLLRQERLLRGQRVEDVANGIGRAGSVVNRVELARQDAGLILLITLSVHFGIRLSSLLCPAEDAAFPGPDRIWTHTPHRYLGHSVAEDPDSIVLALAGTNPATQPDAVHLAAHDVALLLRRARTQRHLRPADVGQACGIGATAITRVELARKALRLSRFVTACVYLGVRPSDLVRLAEDHAFPDPSTVWTDHPRRALAWLSATASQATAPHATTPQVFRLPAAQVWCGHYDAEISVELRHGQPIEIIRCVACGRPIPATAPAPTATAAPRRPPHPTGIR